MWWLIILLIILAIIVIYVVSTFNSLKTLQVRIKASIQEIGNQLKRQGSLIPNLQASVKGSTKHEKEIYHSLTDARKMTQTVKATDMEGVEKLGASLQNLSQGFRVVMESNPNLQAQASFAQLNGELVDSADKLMYARRTLINLANNYNQKLEVFPSNIVAKIFGFKPEKGLDTPTEGAHISVSESETHDPQINFD